MIKRILFISLFLLELGILRGQILQKDTILLFHPTVYNIKTISHLLQNAILPLDNVHFKGVGHRDGVYDYSQSAKYIEKNPELPFSLLLINHELYPDSLFGYNACSETFSYLFDHSAGAIFMGGPDIPPEVYGEKRHLLSRVNDPGRHYLELSYLFHILGGKQNSKHKAFMKNRKNYGVLGICLGMQSINVATGGTMVQDIPTELYRKQYIEDILESAEEEQHRNYYPENPMDTTELTGYHFHPIRISKRKSALSSFSKENPSVLSSHHQAIEEIGKGLMPIAWSMDEKIIEAVAHRKYPYLLGIQFHPEKTGLFDLKETFSITKDSTINFNKYLKSRASMDFHLNLWQEVSLLFKE